jgi:energy-coupling factor transporter ATP-binding protein EcfA2
MARVFVSFASKDLPLATEVHRWLADHGHDAFLDRDLHDGILVGDAWQQRLHERLRWADALVCVLTSAYLTSPWCSAELGIAQSRGGRLLPVRAEEGVRHPLLDSIQYVDMTVDAGAARAKLAEALLRIDAAGGYGWPDDRSPFPGLRPLDTAERSVFFGRSQEIQQLATPLRSPAERADPAVLLVVGPSGCGKSSLVRAGLLPVLAAEEDWWALPPVLPGRQPVAALASAMAHAAHQVGLAWTVTEVNHRLRHGGLTVLVHDLLLAAPGHRRRLLLVVDQFEELLAQTAPEERARFAALLSEALAGPVQVLATLRPEFLAPLLASPELAALPTRTQTVRPLRPEALRAVIEGPADRAGISLDDGLVARLVADTGGGEALPLLAYTLEKLAADVTRGGQLSTTRYEELGGVQGALARQADAALAEAVTASGRDRDQVIRELLRLVDGLGVLPGVRILRIWADSAGPTGVVSFTVAGADPGLVAAYLSAEDGIGVRDGRFCAHPLLARLGAPEGALRASVGVGTTRADVDRLLAALDAFLSTGPRAGYARRDGRWEPVDDPRPLADPAALARGAGCGSPR